MGEIVAYHDKYAIWQLSKGNLRELAEFVVRENYKHHANGDLPGEFDNEVEMVYNEELTYYSRSRVLVAKDSDGKIIGAIRLICWDGVELLPIQKLFGRQSIMGTFPAGNNAATWHIGRLAVSTDIGRYGLHLFKLLLLYSMQPICECGKGTVFAECDSRLLRTMRLMGIQVHSIGDGIEYLGSETIPVYATCDGIIQFYKKNRSLIKNRLKIFA